MILRLPKTILVTGGCGFIGSAFIRRLLGPLRFSGKIINLDLMTYAANLDNVKEIASHPGYQFVKGDICNGSLVQELLSRGVDAIVHFAAETHVDRSIASALPFIETNVKGTLMLLEAMRLFPSVHFHHVSTDEVYGALGMEGVFCEESPYLPNSPYAASKAASDHLVRAFMRTYGLSTTISHCSNNYGPGQYPEKLIPLMIEKCLKGEPLPVYGRGKQVREWIYVDDHVDAIWTILQKGKAGETYDVKGQVELQNIDLVHQLIEVLAEQTGQLPKRYLSLIRFVDDRLGHDFRYAIEGAKLQRELGWSAKVPFAEGLASTVKASLQKNGQSVICQI
jgi:dTDP-glucose 4,6-dehydratase